MQNIHQNNKKIMIKIMILIASCDGEFSKSEFQRISRILLRHPFLMDVASNKEEFTQIVSECTRFSNNIASIREIIKDLPEEYHLPTLAFAYEICVADGEIDIEEKKMLRNLHKVLNISEQHISALEIAAYTRFFVGSPIKNAFPITRKL